MHKLRNKPVDWYDDWQRIFGKDRATGEHAEGPADIIENLDKEECEGAEISGSTDNSPANDKKKKRAKLQEELLISMEKMQENVGTFLNGTAQQLGIMTQRMRYDHDLAKVHRDVYGIMNNIHNSTKQEKLIVTSKIVNEPADIDLFLSLPEEL